MMGNGNRVEACVVALGLWACLACGSVSAQNLTFDEPEDEPAEAPPGNARTEPKPETKSKRAGSKATDEASRKAAGSSKSSHAGSTDTTDEESAEASRTMDQLLDGALDGQKPIDLKQDTGGGATSKKVPPMPQVPTGPSILAAIKVVAPALRACAQGQSGNVQLMVVLAGNGRAKSARLSGPPFAGTGSGRCMEGVLRRARFPRFASPQFRVSIPLALQ